MTTGARRGLIALALVGACAWMFAGESRQENRLYTVIDPLTQGNLTVFPVVADLSHDTHNLLTLDEGIKSGEVVVTEYGGAIGLQRQRGVWNEHPWPTPPVPERAQVNQLSLVNNSDRPLVLLAGEIVTGGKQDRVVGKDLIIPPKSAPVALGVFCVEPHRWVETSSNFGALAPAMAQLSVRQQAQAGQNQQEVWNEVAKSRQAFAAAVPAPAAQAIQSSSSYAQAVANVAVQRKMEAVVGPIERSYEALLKGLRAQKAVGAVVAINGEVVWADVFASSALLEKYWPKLIRSYAAEAMSAGMHRASYKMASVKDAQVFLDDLRPMREKVDSEPGVYRNTEVVGDDFDAFILTSLLPGTGYTVHLTKMRN